MANLQDIVDKQNLIEQSLSTRMAEFERQLNNPETTESRSLEALSVDFKTFKETVSSILSLFRQQISSILNHLDDLERHNRRNMLLFRGIPEARDEDLRSKVTDIIHNKLALKDFESSQIILCNRLGSSIADHTRPVVVHFNNPQTKDTVWFEKSMLKSTGLAMSEFLTKPRQLIFSKARKHFGMTHCWSRNGVIYVGLPGDVRKRVNTMGELDELIAQFPKKSGSSTAPNSGEQRQGSNNASSRTRSASTSRSQTMPMEPPPLRKAAVRTKR